VAGLCKFGSELSASVTFGEFLDKLKNFLDSQEGHLCRGINFIRNNVDLAYLT